MADEKKTDDKAPNAHTAETVKVDASAVREFVKRSALAGAHDWSGPDDRGYFKCTHCGRKESSLPQEVLKSDCPRSPPLARCLGRITVGAMKPAPRFSFSSFSSSAGLLLTLLATAACDKPDAPADKPASSAAASISAPAPAPSPAPTPSAATPAPTASAAGPGSSSSPVKDAVVSVLDPTSKPESTAKVLAGGSVALYLPEWAGTSWKVAQPDKALGIPKEETIPGFAGPTTPAHAFTWQIKDALKGQVHKVALANSTKGKPGASSSFTLSIDVN